MDNQLAAQRVSSIFRLQMELRDVIVNPSRYNMG